MKDNDSQQTLSGQVSIHQTGASGRSYTSIRCLESENCWQL